MGLPFSFDLPFRRDILGRVMKRRFSASAPGLAALALLSACLAAPAAAQTTSPGQGQGQGQPPPRATTPLANQSLATLYERLKSAGTAQEAEVLVRQIARRWARSGSDTSDLLMARAKQALGAQNGPLAVELLDRVIALQPGWAEAWHVRGMAFFVMQDDGRALVDFREALRREPGHFMALGMAATALRRQGDDRSALAAYRRLQDLHPFFTGAKDAIEKLAPSVDGRDI